MTENKETSKVDKFEVKNLKPDNPDAFLKSLTNLLFSDEGKSIDEKVVENQKIIRERVESSIKDGYGKFLFESLCSKNFELKHVYLFAYCKIDSTLVELFVQNGVSVKDVLYALFDFKERKFGSPFDPSSVRGILDVLWRYSPEDFASALASRVDEFQPFLEKYQFDLDYQKIARKRIVDQHPEDFNVSLEEGMDGKLKKTRVIEKIQGFFKGKTKKY